MQSLLIPDILFQVAARVDDCLLFQLYLIFNGRIVSLVENNNFWYIRSRLLIGRELQGRSANWSKIYYSLVEARGNEEYELVFYGLDYLPSRLVLEEVYGTSSREIEWVERVTPDVLRHLIATEQVQPDEENILLCFERVIEEGQVDMIELLYSLLESIPYFIDYDRVTSYCMFVIDKKQMDMSKLILNLQVKHKEILQPDIMSDLLATALKCGDWTIISLVLRLYTSNETLLADIQDRLCEASSTALQPLIDANLITLCRIKDKWNDALRERSVGVVQFLIEGQHITDTVDWNKILEESIRIRCGRDEDYNFIRYILTKTSAASPDNKILKLVVDNGSVLLLRVVLEDPRVSPMDNICEILTEAVRHDNHKILSVLLTDKRVKIEELKKNEVRLLSRFFSSRLNADDINCTLEEDAKCVSSFWSGRSIFVLVERMQQDDMYALLLRFILAKRPTNSELITWMQEQKNKQLVSAARSVVYDLGDVPSEILPLRELMLFLLYPTLTLTEEMKNLTRERVGRSEIKAAMQLVSLFLTQKKIRADLEKHSSLYQ